MNSIERIEKKVGVRINGDLNSEIVSLYGDNFKNDKDNDVIKFVEQYYTLHLSSDITNRDILSSVIKLVLLNIISYLVICTFYTLLFFNSSFSKETLLDNLVSFLPFLVFILIIAIGGFLFGYFQQVQHNEDTLSVIKFKSTIKFVTSLLIIFSIIILITNIYLFSDSAWGFIWITGLFNILWGLLLGNSFYFKK